MSNKLKILTILGTRPEIIRLSRIIPKLEKNFNHYLLHTGQNFDSNLSTIFFNELKLKKPNSTLNSQSPTVGAQIGKIIIGVEEKINEFKPDKVLILGDTNSGLGAIICEKLNIPVYHMEAGNRCFDLSVPEEKNRKIIDSISTINLPYTNISRDNLIKEGIPNQNIIVTGNPIKEVIDFYQSEINNSRILENLNLEKNNYIIATAHRAENVDNSERLKSIISSLEYISTKIKVIFSCHPRTKQKLMQARYDSSNPNFIISEPFGFFDFIKLEQNSKMAITDSGTVQEEMCIFGIPTITIRETTERPETVWCGSNIVSGLSRDRIIGCFDHLYDSNLTWKIPEEYLRSDVSNTIINILAGK